MLKLFSHETADCSSRGAIFGLGYLYDTRRQSYTALRILIPSNSSPLPHFDHEYAQAHVLRPGADSTGPPPPPPPTPAQTTPSQPTRHTFGSIGSGRGGEHSSGGESSHVGGDTEAFAVDDESEGEAYFSSSKGVGRGGVLEAKGGGEPRDVTQSRLGGGTVSSVDEGSGGGDGGKDGENGEDGRVVGGGVGGGGGGT